MVESVRGSLSVPLIVGGGIRMPQQAHSICKAGADIVVIGTAFEKEPGLIREIAEAVHTS